MKVCIILIKYLKDFINSLIPGRFVAFSILTMLRSSWIPLARFSLKLYCSASSTMLRNLKFCTTTKNKMKNKFNEGNLLNFYTSLQYNELKKWKSF